MDDQKIIKISVGVIIVGIILLLYSQKDRFFGTEPSFNDVQISNQQINRIKKLEDKQKAKENSTEDKKDHASTAVVKNTSPEKKSAEQILIEKSEVVKEKFLSTLKAQAVMPENLKFIDYDLEENTVAIYGYDKRSDLSAVIMGIAKDVKKEEVLPYLDQNQDAFPNTKNNPVVKIGEAKALPKPSAGSGVRDGTLWSGVLQDGKEVHIVMLRREDAKGSYFFLYSGPSDYFQSNDDYFGSLYESFKALPVE